jgi:hypothetical protein
LNIEAFKREDSNEEEEESQIPETLKQGFARLRQLKKK